MKIILSIALTLLLLGCSEKKNDTAEKAVVKTDIIKSIEKKAPVEKKEIVKTEVSKKQIPKKTVVRKKEPVVALDGSKLFKKCTACHGTYAEKKALNKSHVIQGWSSASIIKALNGYKDGIYGGSMKSVMKVQVSKLSKEEIKALAKYISTL